MENDPNDLKTRLFNLQSRVSQLEEAQKRQGIIDWPNDKDIVRLCVFVFLGTIIWLFARCRFALPF